MGGDTSFNSHSLYLRLQGRRDVQSPMDTKEETRRLEDKLSNYRGTAKIHLKHLTFDSIDQKENLISHVDPKNVARLIQIFKIEGCLRLNEEHRIAAIISEGVLEKALKGSSLTQHRILAPGDPPQLKFDGVTTIRCLHGKHRIAAAKEVLVVGDKWWVVDLYSDGK